MVCERFDIIDLRGGDERCDAAPGVPTFVVAGKKRILSRQSNWADQVFDGIGVDFDPTVVRKGLQPAPLPMDIGQLLAEAGLRGHPAPLVLKPLAELCNQWRRAGPTCREALTGTHPPELAFNAVELCDPAQPFCSDL